MSVPPSRRWSDLTTAEFAGLDMSSAVALLPVGAMEQHGPHLPLSVDTDIALALVDGIAQAAPPDLPLLVLPPLPVGVSPEHADFPGTLTLQPETMLAVLGEIGESVHRSGIRRLAILNSHGGQPQMLDIMAQRLRSRFGMVVASLNAYRYWDAAGAFGEEEAAWGIHGGAAETSIMLHARPEAVRQDRLAAFPNAAREMAANNRHLRPYGRTVGLGWQMQDLNPEGAAGDATRATAEAGEQLLNQAVQRCVEILQELAALDPDAFVAAGPG